MGRFQVGGGILRVAARVVLFIFLSFVGAATWAQADPPAGNDFVTRWFQRADQARSEQPPWAAPMFTLTPGLVQQFRYDVSWQPNRFTNTNYGAGKGIEVIPVDRVEVFVSAPPYITHTNPLRPDGFGDLTFGFRYRLAAENADNGNYVVTALLTATAPTGTSTNGSTHALFTPTLALGKGWGNFDLQGTAGVTLPSGDVSVIGTPLALNLTAQYRILNVLWPEAEINSTIWNNGSNEGKKQVFLSPGIVVGRLHLWRRLNLAFGAGVQIAATHFHTYNHNWQTSVRFPF